MVKTVHKGINHSKRILAAVGYKMLSVVGSNNYKHFVVLTRSRTGSNLLISLLNSHPAIKAEGEVFARLNGRNYQDILSKKFSKQPSFLKAKGFKIFYYHPLDNRACGIWEELSSMQNLHVIHLKRKNVLHTLLSRKIAGINDVWLVRSDQSSSPPKEQVAVEITEEELLQGIKETKEWEQDGDATFQKQPLLSINYEDLVEDRPDTLHKVFDFLGVPFIEPKTNMKKQNTTTMRETIKNYDELKSRFAQTEWATFFED